MKKKLKIVIITIAIIFVVTIIGYIVSAVLAFSGIGNPIIRYKASKDIKEYIELEYLNNDFDGIKVYYNFKDGQYGASVSSKSSVDTHFHIYYDDGKVYDNYDEYVTNGINTYNRVCAKFNSDVQTIVNKTFNNEVDLCLYDIYRLKSEPDYFDEIIKHVPFDGDLDIKDLADLNVAPEITVWFISKEMSFDILAEKFVQIKELMDKEEIPVDVYSISLRFPRDMREGRFDEELHVHNFPAELIQSNNFIQNLIEYDKDGRTIETKHK